MPQETTPKQAAPSPATAMPPTKQPLETPIAPPSLSLLPKFDSRALDISFGSSRERRWQTFAVLVFVLVLPCHLVCWLAWLLLLLLPPIAPFALAYLAWARLLDASPVSGARAPLLRNLPLWRHFAAYFPVKMLKSADLDPEGKYVIGYHPHGIISMGAAACFGANGAGFSELFPGIDCRLLTLPINFKSPFLREFLLWCGLCDSSKKACRNILARGPGSAIVLVVGGAEEALHTKPRRNDLVLQKRRGFVREAIRAGASLVPCYAFGENDLYDTHTFEEGTVMRKLQDFGKQKFSFSMPIFYGRGIFARALPLLMPHRRPVTVVMGAPIPVPKVDATFDFKSEEGKQLVIDTHTQYLKALQELFDTYRDQVCEGRDRTGSLHFR